MQKTTHIDLDAERARQALVRRRRALLPLNDESSYDLSLQGEHPIVDPIEKEEEIGAAAALGLLTLHEQRELLEIDLALERIVHGRWGLCEACGHAIGHQLLRASPQRALCLGCEVEPSQG